MLRDELIDVRWEKGSRCEEAPRPKPEEQAAECRARAAMYRILSGVFAEEVSAEFLRALRDETLLAQLTEVGLCFDDDFLTPSEQELLDALAVEYTALFASTGGFPPIESVRLHGLLQQEPAFQVEGIYRTYGFIVKPGRFTTFPDHLGVELLFVAELLERCAEALDAGEQTTARKLEKAVKRFWAQHLGRWVRGYGRLIQRAAGHSFYREMARLLTLFAEEELAAMGLSVEDRDQGKLIVPIEAAKVAFNPEEPVCNACEVGAATPYREGAVSVLQDLR